MKSESEGVNEKKMHEASDCQALTLPPSNSHLQPFPDTCKPLHPSASQGSISDTRGTCCFARLRRSRFQRDRTPAFSARPRKLIAVGSEPFAVRIDVERAFRLNGMKPRLAVRHQKSRCGRKSRGVLQYAWFVWKRASAPSAPFRGEKKGSAPAFHRCIMPCTHHPPQAPAVMPNTWRKL